MSLFLPTGPACQSVLLGRADGRAGKTGEASTLSRLLTSLCVLLVLVFGTVQVTHAHDLGADGLDSHAACSLCVASHAGIQLTAVPVVQTATVFLEDLAPGAVQAAFAPRLNFQLFSRPPPVASTPSRSV